MNLEPLVTTLLSMLLLDEVLTSVQTVGAGVMILALCAFQLSKAKPVPVSGIGEARHGG